MGSQVNFYLHPEDEEQFRSFIATDQCVVILYETRLDKPLVPVERPVPDAETPWCGFFSLWNTSIASRDLITPPNRLVGGEYDINAYVYPVVQLWRSSLTAEGLTPGRIWATFDHSCLSPEKQRALRLWFRRLANWLNKLPYRWGMYRIGPKAREYFDQGGKALGYAMGDPKQIIEHPSVKIVRRNVRTLIQQPEIENDGGKSDLTIEL